MRRADRLFQIIQLLRGRRRAVTAQELATRLEVSERTVYRDIRDLMATGTPIQGEAGVGYTLKKEYDLPPLMFDEEELAALVLGARVVAAHGDAALAEAAGAVLSKVEAVLPKELRARLDDLALFTPGRRASIDVSDNLQLVRAALSEHRKLTFEYQDEGGNGTQRTVRPLGAFFWGRSWTLTAWCELRDDFRSFRLDRIQAPQMLEERFPDVPGQTLRDFLARYGPDATALLDR
ncbi:MAG: YafY family transcriptional regulator [Myxococcales bacterium]|nr:YafY family transcriptional regulator [Myxococcales bacterium]